MSVKKKFAIATLGVLILMLFLSRFIVDSRDPNLKNTGLEIQYKAKAFTGILFGRYHDFSPRLFAIVWNGKKLWRQYQWHSNGRVFMLNPYRNGKPHGSWKQWYPNGSVKSLRRFINGREHGEFWTWHPNGTVSSFRVFEHGKELRFKSFISDGKPFYNYTYQDGDQVGLTGGKFCKTIEKRRFVQ